MTESKNLTNRQSSITEEISYKHSNYLFILSSISMIILVIIFMTIVTAFVLITNQDNQDQIFTFIFSPFVEFFAVFMPIVVYFLITKKDYKKVLRLNKIKIKHIIAVVILGLAAQVIGNFLNTLMIFLLQFLGQVPTEHVTVPANIFQLVYMIVIIAVLPSIFEELLCRGIILRGYEGFGIKWGIVISAVLFGMLHYSLTNFVFPLFLGLILAYVVYRTNSIFASIILHFTCNTFGVFILYFQKLPQISYYEQISLTDMERYLCFAVIASVITIAALYFIYITTEHDVDKRLTNNKKREAFSFKKLFHWPVIAGLIILLAVFGETIYEILYGIS